MCTDICTSTLVGHGYFPINLKIEAHEALSLLFQQDKVPLSVTDDNAKIMILREFNDKLKEA